ncbi:MAG: VWA domain-containing protein [Pseudomonadota bacterium]|nr:VWA domain-containing protein [Pseudomonadota bacterium]
MNVVFAWPWLLAALPLPLLAWWWLSPAAAAPAPSLRFPFFDAVRATRERGPRRRSYARLALAVPAWLLLVVAAARPQHVGETVHLPVAGRSIMLAVDLSGSMQTPDMQSGREMVSRLAAVKAVAGDFIHRRVGDRLGLILFGDQAYVQAPLTFDRGTVKALLDEAQIGLAGQQTAIGDAIGLAIKRLREEPVGNRVLILLTDGASNSGAVDPLKAADLAAQEGVRIYTIGVGADDAAAPGPFGILQQVPSDLDENALKAIAQKTGGRYFRASDVASLADIYGLLDKIEPRSKDQQSWRPVEELYLWPLGAALLLSALVALSKFGLQQKARVRGITRAGARHA